MREGRPSEVCAKRVAVEDTKLFVSSKASNAFFSFLVDIITGASAL
jgi:hypothetical protein